MHGGSLCSPWKFCFFRAYRIGQSRDVKVFRLISLGTVEEIMYLRQVYKQVMNSHCFDSNSILLDQITGSRIAIDLK